MMKIHYITQYTNRAKAEAAWDYIERNLKIDDLALKQKFSALPDCLQELYRPLFDSFMGPAVTRVGAEELQKGIVGMALEDKAKGE
jgi:hypothetical protein